MTAALTDLGRGTHSSVLYGSEAERVDVVVPFVAAGFGRQERVLVVTESGDDPAVRWALARAGAEPGRMVDEGRLRFCHTADLYLPRGAFEQALTLARWDRETRRALDDGFAGVRITATTGWASAHCTADAFAVYECACERLFRELPALALCQYDRALLGGSGARAATAHQVIHDAPLLTIERGDAGAVSVSGELDVATTHVLAGVLEALEPPPRRLDLSRLDFLDLAGARAIAHARARARFEVVAPSRAARRVLDLAGWGGLLPEAGDA
jgi:anti-anti-sigma factor